MSKIQKAQCYVRHNKLMEQLNDEFNARMDINIDKQWYEIMFRASHIIVKFDIDSMLNFRKHHSMLFGKVIDYITFNAHDMHDYAAKRKVLCAIKNYPHKKKYRQKIQHIIATRNDFSRTGNKKWRYLKGSKTLDDIQEDLTCFHKWRK